VNRVTSEDSQVSGAAEAGSTVKVTFPGGETGTGTANEQGNYTIDIPAGVNLKGGEELVATATDGAGNESSEGKTTVVDITAPEAPTVNRVTSEDSQVSGAAEAGSTVKVTFPGGETATGTANEQGNYTVDIPADVNLKGGEELVVTATDGAGNESSEGKTTVVDTTAPEAPIVSEVTSKSIQIAGKAESHSTVTVTFPEGVIATGKVDETGNYVVEIPENVDLKGGEGLVVTATDEAGNKSPEVMVTVIDTTAPEAPTVNGVTSEDSQVSGTAEAGSTVKVTFPGGETATGTANEQGNYTVDIPADVNLKGGEELVVIATDEAGNKSPEAKTIVVDTTAPEAPTAEEVTSESTQISGRGEPGSTIKVTFPEGVTVTGTVDETGNYVVEIPADVNLKGGEELVVTATDEAGNESPEAKTIVVDTTAPEAPTVNRVTSEDSQVSGAAEAGSTV
ncbi:Ig-like domain-containing protein, partial [Staphylococcus caeli]|uniref:Ig-like domain-containing protein n=1 Tax=Staphylococcus caeli TaxID=2201815 RepID=UPI003F55E1C8